MRTTQQSQSPETETIWISHPEDTQTVTRPEGRFTIIASSNREARKFLNSNPYSAARAFIDGEFDVRRRHPRRHPMLLESKP